MNSDNESPKSHADDFSAFLPSLANVAGSGGLRRFLQNWSMDWLILPDKKSESINFVDGDLIAIIFPLFCWQRSPY